MTNGLVNTNDLAQLLGKSRGTIWRWRCTDPSFAACVVRSTKHSTWWSLQRLRELGFLTQRAEPCLNYELRVAQ